MKRASDIESKLIFPELKKIETRKRLPSFRAPFCMKWENLDQCDWNGISTYLVMKSIVLPISRCRNKRKNKRCSTKSSNVLSLFSFIEKYISIFVLKHFHRLSQNFVFLIIWYQNVLVIVFETLTFVLDESDFVRGIEFLVYKRIEPSGRSKEKTATVLLSEKERECSL